MLSMLGTSKKLLRRDGVLDARDGVTHISLGRQPLWLMDGVVLCCRDNYQGHCQFFEPGAHDISEALSRKGASLYLPQAGACHEERKGDGEVRPLPLLNLPHVLLTPGYGIRLFGWTGLHGPEFRARENITSFAMVPGLHNQIRSIEVWQCPLFASSLRLRRAPLVAHRQVSPP
jgi:hypothetical protein